MYRVLKGIKDNRECHAQTFGEKGKEKKTPSEIRRFLTASYMLKQRAPANTPYATRFPQA